MQTNFKIKELIHVVYQDHKIDLHNYYSFDVGQLMQTEQEILIPFYRISANSENASAPYPMLTFTAHRYSYFEHQQPDADLLADDHALSELSFYPSSDRLHNDQFLDQEEPKPNDDLILFFWSNRIIRIQAEQIMITHQTSLP